MSHSTSSDREPRIDRPGRPQTAVCRQCDDVGFIQTAYGLQECPLCQEYPIGFEDMPLNRQS
jgi:hypothetical protein